MKGYITNITGEIPNTNKEIDISVNGKNLIITGSNGSGKTSFLRDVSYKTNLMIVQKNQENLPQLKQEYENTKKYWKENTIKGTTQYDQYKNHVENQETKLNEILKGLQIKFHNNVEFSSLYDDKVAVVKLFEASRIAQINHADTAKGVSTEEVKAQQQHSQNLGNSLEQHLVNLKSRRSLAISEDNDIDLATKINAWFEHFEENLKILMEDDSVRLGFDSNTLKFSIIQDGKPAYNFQTLSSGYLSIFDIYADLLMRTEYFKVTPQELKGTVFIDEIDAHLHVSLQRLILPFFVKSFPKVQFIVTTHSPFVLMSINDVVIFDLGRNSQIDDDLSFYTYSAVMEGLLGTKTTSVQLENTITEISKITTSNSIDYNKLSDLIEKIKPLKSKLDNRSKAFYLLGVNALLDKEA